MPTSLLIRHTVVAACLAAAGIAPTVVHGQTIHTTTSLVTNGAYRPVPRSFVGVSLDSGWINERFVCPASAGFPAVPPARLRAAARLLRAIGRRAGPPVIRTVGDGTLWQDAPSSIDECNPHQAGLVSPYGTLGPDWVAALGRLAKDADSKVIVGINLAEGAPGPLDTTATARNGVVFARAVQTGFPKSVDSDFEIGNEPDAYAMQNPAVKTTATCPDTLRVCGYETDAGKAPAGGASYLGEYTSIAAQIEAALGQQGVHRFVGPASVGGFQNEPSESEILSVAGPYLGTLTNHHYAVASADETGVALPRQLQDLLVDTRKRTLAGGVQVGAEATGLYTLAHFAANAGTMAPRLDETNSFDAGGVGGLQGPTGQFASQTFATALWAADWTMQLAQLGYSGANFKLHGDYTPFDFPNDSAGQPKTGPTVYPVYYGMLLAAEMLRGAPILLPLTTNPATSCASAAQAEQCFATTEPVRIWGVVDLESAEVRVLIINKSAQRDETQLVVPPIFARATVSRLMVANAPDPESAAESVTGVTLAGQTYDGTPDGSIQGMRETERVHPGAGGYSVAVGAYSAALVTLKL